MPAASVHAPASTGPHVLFLPKWYPGHNDPQLGDFIRKQALAVAGATRTSVLFVGMLQGTRDLPSQEADEENSLWELRCWYQGSQIGFAPLRKLVNLFRYWQAAMQGWRRVVHDRGRPQLVHVHILVRPALVAWWIRLRHDIPYIISEQSSEYLTGAYSAKSAWAKAAYHFLFRRAARVTAVSGFLGEALKRNGLCMHYDVVPNVVPGTERPLPAPGPTGSFLMVADLVDRVKNVSGVLRAFGAARKEDPAFRLAVIGDGEDRQRLEHLSKELGLNGSVTFLGRMSQPEVMEHMARTGAVIVNSNVETFSVVTGEALALGRPVIATRCGGPEAFITPENGTLIAPRNDDALRTAMMAMAASASRYDAAAIRRTVSDRFSPEAVGAAFRKIYEQVIADGAH